MPLTVFISYSSADAAHAKRPRQRLASARVKVWIDHEQLIPGTPDWDVAIRQGIEASDAVVYMASPNARESPFVRSELLVAQNLARRIIPLWVAGKNWIDAAPLSMGSVEYTDARGDLFDGGVTRLLEALRRLPPTKATARSQPTRTPSPAPPSTPSSTFAPVDGSTKPSASRPPLVRNLLLIVPVPVIGLIPAIVFARSNPPLYDSASNLVDGCDHPFHCVGEVAGRLGFIITSMLSGIFLSIGIIVLVFTFGAVINLLVSESHRWIVRNILLVILFPVIGLIPVIVFALLNPPLYDSNLFGSNSSLVDGCDGLFRCVGEVAARQWYTITNVLFAIFASVGIIIFVFTLVMVLSDT